MYLILKIRRTKSTNNEVLDVCKLMQLYIYFLKTIDWSLKIGSQADGNTETTNENWTGDEPVSTISLLSNNECLCIQ